MSGVTPARDAWDSRELVLLLGFHIGLVFFGCSL